ncbi:MAG: acetyl-CoA carboxylase carboxyltransferase subunit alpha/beta [Streptosporangiales bacterium]|nr:acetyl-CoA carboxylase carboxyltransferase subunit alpha/beta [Streptosporangiales bacterium]
MANALDLLATLLDDGTYRSWDTAPAGPRPDAAYSADLERARTATGLDESVITGEGTLRGHRVAVAAGEFGFLGGSIGVAAGERVTRAAERALASRLPFIVAPASGGTRMQEGTVAFVQMVKITAAVTALKNAGLPYLVYLRHPTTGGVFASWASLGHVTLAEPGALIGFLGPRVYEALEGTPFPSGVQTAENLAALGRLDAVVPADALPAYLDRVLTALSPGPETGGAGGTAAAAAGPSREAAPTADAWESVLRTRQPGRPGAAELIGAAATDVAPLRHEGGLLLALARIGGRPCVIAGQDRGPAGVNGPSLTAGALRQARRGMRLAGEFGVPFVSVIDTPGAELSRGAEEDGIAGEIAQCIAAMITLRVPTVSVLLGQGTGGGALALLPADRVIAAGHAWLAPLAPEGASAIVYKDTAHAAELAGRQRIGAPDLAAAGLVDQVVSETGALSADVAAVLRSALAVLAAEDDDARQAARLRRYRDLGL